MRLQKTCVSVLSAMLLGTIILAGCGSEKSADTGTQSKSESIAETSRAQDNKVEAAKEETKAVPAIETKTERYGVNEAITLPQTELYDPSEFDAEPWMDIFESISLTEDYSIAVGNFDDDFLDGEIVLEMGNPEQEDSMLYFDLLVNRGALVIDDRWQKQEIENFPAHYIVYARGRDEDDAIREDELDSEFWNQAPWHDEDLPWEDGLPMQFAKENELFTADDRSPAPENSQSSEPYLTGEDGSMIPTAVIAEASFDSVDGLKDTALSAIANGTVHAPYKESFTSEETDFRIMRSNYLYDGHAIYRVECSVYRIGEADMYIFDDGTIWDESSLFDSQTFDASGFFWTYFYNRFETDYSSANLFSKCTLIEKDADLKKNPPSASAPCAQHSERWFDTHTAITDTDLIPGKYCFYGFIDGESKDRYEPFDNGIFMIHNGEERDTVTIKSDDYAFSAKLGDDGWFEEITDYPHKVSYAFYLDDSISGETTISGKYYDGETTVGYFYLMGNS